MSTNSYVQVPPDSTGKKLFTQQHTVGDHVVQGQVVHIADAHSPENTQHVDFRGAASVRFSEGSPLSDAFGNLKVSNRRTIGVYEYGISSMDELFSDTIAGAGLITYMPTYSSINLSVGAASGDLAKRVSNKYHYYYPGTSNLMTITVALSDQTHIGCERRWGMFDDNDGAYFSLTDLGELKVVVRNSVTGVVVKSHMVRASWNGDPVDGTGNSGFNLNVSKLNIYWIDYQWLGGGRIRFGVIDEYGNRIVCHTMLNANSSNYPYMRSGSLPVQVNIENKYLTGGAASIRMTCCSVQSEGEIDYTYWRYSHEFPNTTIAGSNVYCLGLKSVNTISAGHNRTNAYPESFGCFIAGGSAKIDIYWDYLSVSGATWALDNDSTVIADTAGELTLSGGEYKAATFYLDAGSHNLDLTTSFDKNDIGISSNANGATPQFVVVVATLLSGSPIIQGSVKYAEVG